MFRDSRHVEKVNTDNLRTPLNPPLSDAKLESSKHCNRRQAKQGFGGVVYVRGTPFCLLKPGVEHTLLCACGGVWTSEVYVRGQGSTHWYEARTPCPDCRKGYDVWKFLDNFAFEETP